MYLFIEILVQRVPYFIIPTKLKLELLKPINIKTIPRSVTYNCIRFNIEVKQEPKMILVFYGISYKIQSFINC